MIIEANKDFEKIVIEEIPLIDVRAPVEFHKGAFKNAVNLPLMNDEERHLVGICYKEKGSEEAVKLGHKLVSGETRQKRIDAWANFINKHPDSMLYCFRGGLRSKISQEWIYGATSKEIKRIEGGYKAFRNYLITALEPSEQKATPILLGGNTGCGKTILLRKLDNSVDLEAIANHRGSSFGRHITSQPTQIDFENNLAHALIKHKHKYYRHIIVEDEGSNIGKCFLPKTLFEYFKSGKLVIIDLPFEERVAITMKEYVIQSQEDYSKEFGEEQGIAEWSDYITESMKKIKKRLGGDRYKCVIDAFELACKEQIYSSRRNLHKNWIEILLKEYYDPMYNYQMQQNSDKILFRGNADEVLAYLGNLEH